MPRVFPRAIAFGSTPSYSVSRLPTVGNLKAQGKMPKAKTRSCARSSWSLCFSFCLLPCALCLQAGIFQRPGMGTTPLAQSADLDRFRVDPDRYLTHVRTLASDELGGRGNGTPGLARAAEYIASEFKKARLEPGGDTATYLQAFDAAGRYDDAASTLLFRSTGVETPFRVGIHYYPLSAPSPLQPPTRPTVELVFAGYGIAAPGLGYDDYAGLDVNGKAVVVFTHEPQENDPRSVFDGRTLTPHSDIGHKADVALGRGARLLIVVEDPSHVADRALTSAWKRDPQIAAYGIPVVRVDRARLDRMLTALDIDSVAREIDLTLRPMSRALVGATITYTEPLVALSPQLHNVVGILKGSDPSLASEAIVIGAHYDHLGLGSRFSRQPEDAGQIHNGADDNASGTSVVIEMAHAASGQRARFKRSVVFATFAGEELGLLGSAYYVQHAPLSIRKTIAMMNLDMVGRAHGRVMISGIERQPRLARLVAELKPLSTLRLDDFRDGYGDGASDNDSFEREHVPTLLFFTGFHDDYHRPTDDWDLIDAPGAVEIARLALAITARLSNP